MENLNLNALRVFAMAARHGSFQRAAEALHLSHGAVSQRVRQLESDLGVILFDRKPRGVVLTAKGRVRGRRWRYQRLRTVPASRRHG